MEFKKLKFRVPDVLKSVKLCLAGVNGVFLLTGFVLLALGIVILLVNGKYEDLITQRFFTIPAFVLATAVFIFLSSILGFYAAISEKFYFVAGYVGTLLVVLIFDMAIIIAAYTLRDNTTSEIPSTMLESKALYDSRLDVAKLWDDLQSEFECCGVAGRHDWTNAQVPVSCCHIDYGTVSPFVCTYDNAYSIGCQSALGSWLAYNIEVVGIVAALVFSIQVIITAFGGWLAYRSKYEEVQLES